MHEVDCTVGLILPKMLRIDGRLISRRGEVSGLVSLGFAMIAIMTYHLAMCTKLFSPYIITSLNHYIIESEHVHHDTCFITVSDPPQYSHHPCTKTLQCNQLWTIYWRNHKLLLIDNFSSTQLDDITLIMT